MSRSYSTDLRVRVIEAISGGLSRRRAAARFGIGVSTAVTWYRRYRETGEVRARKQGQPGGSKLDAHERHQDELPPDALSGATTDRHGEHGRATHRQCLCGPL